MVDRTGKKEHRPKVTGATRKMHQMTPGADGPDSGTDSETGLSPNLQAHIGRHLRAAFDEVAREPIPERLLQLLKDLERSGGK
jgi:hypothetical protein